MRKSVWERIVSGATASRAAPQPKRSIGFDQFPPPLEARKLQILLVEDDEPDAYLIGRALLSNRSVGEVVVAQNGFRALELIDIGGSTPDLAIVDLNMPRKNGFALLRDFAARDGRRFPSIILTSSAAKLDSLEATICGAVEFITKPNSPSELAATLDRVIYNVL
jgi:CheY-like chemotaxis protein